MARLNYFDFKNLAEKLQAMNLNPSGVYSTCDGITVEVAGAVIGVRSSHEITVRPAHGNTTIVWNARIQDVMDLFQETSTNRWLKAA